MALHQLGKLDEAAEIYRKLLPSNASSTELLVNLIGLSMARKDDAKTKEYSERMLKIRPQSRQALEGLTTVALFRAGLPAAPCSTAPISLRSLPIRMKRGSTSASPIRKPAVWTRLETPIAKPPSSGPKLPKPALLHLGVVLEERGDLYRRASRLQETALAAAPDSPGVLWNLALLDEREGRVEDAERHFAKLVALKPDFEDAAFRLGFLQIQRGDFAAAVDCFELCTKQRGDWVEALVNHGLAYWKFQDLDGATQTFERILSLRPQNTDALRALTAIAIERKDHNRAWDLHQQLIPAWDSAPWSCRYNPGPFAPSPLGDPDRAAQCYQAASETQPSISPRLSLIWAMRSRRPERTKKPALLGAKPWK